MRLMPSFRARPLWTSSSSVPVTLPWLRSVQRPSTEIVTRSTGMLSSILPHRARRRLCSFQVSHQNAQNERTVTLPGFQVMVDASGLASVNGCMRSPGAGTARATRCRQNQSHKGRLARACACYFLTSKVAIREFARHRGAAQRLGHRRECRNCALRLRAQVVAEEHWVAGSLNVVPPTAPVAHFLVIAVAAAIRVSELETGWDRLDYAPARPGGRSAIRQPCSGPAPMA